MSAADSPAPAHSQAVRHFSPGVLLLVGLMFLLSGSSALAYEVVWTRQLTTFFGSTLYGVATVLSTFMGGLALGSWLAGRRADKLRTPLAVFGYLELGTAAAALLFPFALQATQPIIGAFYATGGEGTFYLFSLVRFVVTFALLMVPTTLMGATLPVLSKAVTENMERVGHRVGGLYALNTAGAVLGVFLTGFVLLEALGVFRTTLLAVANDALIGAACVVLGKKYFVMEPATEQEAVTEETVDEEERYSPAVIRLVLATYMMSGFIALAWQVCWTRSLLFSFDRLKATTYSFSGMLTVFLLGLAIGSALMQAIVDKQRNLLRLYAFLIAGIGLSGGLSFFMIVQDWPILTEVQEDTTLIYWNAVANVMWKTAVAIGLPTLLMGMAFPVVSRLVVGSLRSLSLDISKVYALNTIGAIGGSFASGFILIPLIGIRGTIALLSAVALLMAAALFAANMRMPQPVRMAWALVLVVAAGLVPVRILGGSSMFQRLQPNEKMVHYEEGALATVSVIENNSGDRMIYVDDVGVAGTDKIMLTDQKSLAHVPMMLLGGQATRALSVGFGSGGASFSYTLYDGIEEIHTIEIAPEVLRAAPTLTASNHGIIAPDELIERAQAAGAGRITGFRHPLAEYVHTPLPGFKTFDPRFRVVLEDARSYLRFTEKKYDIIATDCTDLRYKSNANLYDLEYFELCRDAITDRGLVVVWMPLAGLSDTAFRSALRTFQVVFPEMSVWYFTNQPTHYCLLIGGKGPLRFDYQEIVKATALPQVSDDLEEIGLRNPEKLISSFVCDERTLVKHLEDAPLNTEDHPIIEFLSPRFGYGPEPLYINQRRLYDIQVPAGDLLTNVPDGEGVRERIWELQQANDVVFEGHSEYRRYNFVEAAKLYVRAAEMVPYDESLQELLDFRELRRHWETALEDPALRLSLNTLWVGHGLASAFRVQERWSDAATVAERTLQVVPQALRSGSAPAGMLNESGAALANLLGEVYDAAGRPERAQQYRKMADEYEKASGGEIAARAPG